MKKETYDEIMSVLSEEEKITTQDLALKLGLSRAVTSLYLNELLQKSELAKVGTRPVYWSKQSSRNKSNSIFSQYIGFDGSAAEAISKCQSAVLYPPLGLPVLIHGSSGVGKSFLAHLIFEYLKEQQVPGAENFFVFNCADYANNPELLSSILFGHTKGAFTGANEKKKGLLSLANNGVLFLDEVHRLSHENQEKLFQFMDTGKFRPIGEDEMIESSNVRLLFATTEDPSQVLLPTFYRRISVIVHLPSFHERPLYERKALLNHLFYREAIRVKKDIVVDISIFHHLLGLNLVGNIGSLENEIKMYCAEALRQQPNNQELVIGSSNEQKVSIRLNEKLEELVYEKDNWHQRYLALFEDTRNLETIQSRLYEFDEVYLDGVIMIENDALALMIEEEVQKENSQMIDQPLLTLEPIQIIGKLLQVLDGPVDVSLDYLNNELRKHYPRTQLFANYLCKGISSELHSFVEVLLAILMIGKINEDIRYQALLVAHGNTTASSIQSVANKLSNEYIFDAINMPLSSSVNDIIEKTKMWLSERDTSEGVIMLVDMGSLTQLYKSLKPQIMGELLVINNLTTSYALEIGQQLVNGQLFYEIAKKAEQNFVTEVQYFEGFSVEKNIIISSISGIDVAKKIKKIVEKYVNPDIKHIILNYNELMRTLDKAYEQENYLKETSLILTTSYLENKTDVASMNLLDALDEDAENHLVVAFNHLIHPSNIANLQKELIHFFSKEGLSEKLEFLNPDVIIKQVEEIIDKIERRFGLTLSPKMKFNLMMHLAVMVERMMLGGANYPVPEDINELKINQKPFYQNMKNIVSVLEQFYRIDISNWELYVLYEILMG